MLNRHFPKAAFVLFALIGIAWGLNVPAQSAYDDAYITYRYAGNLAQGLGLVYNRGEWVLGVTTPRYALLLTPAAALGLPAIVYASHWLTVACWIVTAWLAYRLLRQAGYVIGALAAGLLVIVQPVLLSSLGMEGTFVTALMLLSAWAWWGRHTRLAAVSGAALILARQDAALWLLFLGVGVWVARSIGERIDGDDRPFGRWVAALPWREGFGCVLLTLPWFAF